MGHFMENRNSITCKIFFHTFFGTFQGASRITPYVSFQEIHRKSDILIADQYGNYVIQHILEHGANPDRQRVLTSVKGRIVQLSQHKFASNVIEKCVTSSSREDRVIIINEVCQNPGIDRTFSLVS